MEEDAAAEVLSDPESLLLLPVKISLFQLNANKLKLNK